jgi:hypothetical protein
MHECMTPQASGLGLDSTVGHIIRCLYDLFEERINVSRQSHRSGHKVILAGALQTYIHNCQMHADRSCCCQTTHSGFPKGLVEVASSRCSKVGSRRKTARADDLTASCSYGCVIGPASDTDTPPTRTACLHGVGILAEGHPCRTGRRVHIPR